MPGDCAVVDPEACGRSRQDRPSGLPAAGRALACGRIARGVDSGSGGRGDSRSGPGARGCGQRPHPGPAAAQGFLLRHDVRYAGKTSWSKTYYRWLATLNFGLSGAQTAFTEYWQAVTAADERVARLTEALANSIAGWRFEPVVQALQALRGIDQISAIGLVAEIGDIGRFAHPRQLMAYLGLVPSESFQRRAGGPRQHHQDRQCACAAAADRGGVELSLPSRASAAGRSAARRTCRRRSATWPGRRSCGSPDASLGCAPAACRSTRSASRWRASWPAFVWAIASTQAKLAQS